MPAKNATKHQCAPSTRRAPSSSVTRPTLKCRPRKEISGGLGVHDAAEHDVRRVPEDAQVFARIARVHEQVGGRAVVEAGVAEPVAGTPGRAREGLLAGHARAVERLDLVDEPAVLDHAPGVTAREDAYAGFDGRSDHLADA